MPEIPDWLERAMVAHGVDPEEVARQAEELDLDAPREGDSEPWKGPPFMQEPDMQEALDFDELDERRDG